jgi:hypothetical protein
MTKPACSTIAILAACLAIAGCATVHDHGAAFPVSIAPGAEQVRIVDATARVEPYGLVVRGDIAIAAHSPAPAVHSVDIVIAGPDKREIRKFTTLYFPAPKAGRKKLQRADFAIVTYEVPPTGSSVSVSFTPQPKQAEPSIPPSEPETPAPENR